MTAIDVLKLFLPAATAFLIGIAITPRLTDYLYSRKMWKQKVRTVTLDGREAKFFSELHKEKEVGTPRMGGIVIWASVLFTVILFWALPKVIAGEFADGLNFLSRNQTWLPLFTLISASLVGLVDDYFEVRGLGQNKTGGLSLSSRIAIVLIIGLAGGWWWFAKLEILTLTVPLLGEVPVSWTIIPIFAAVMLALYSGSVIDGIDGLAGGVMASIFGAYAGIAFFKGQFDLATFCAVVVGGILAFLWFNIPPARFYMTETGIMGLTTSLTVVAFLTDSVFPLIIIAAPLLATSASDVIQLLSKKFRSGRKIFLAAPLHHHFEALGWPSYKVTMRYWVISVILAIIGMIVALI